MSSLWLAQTILAAAAPASADPGALVDVRLSSTAGVLLDEVPAEHRDAVAAEVLARGGAFWEARAQQQINAMKYRLVYRNFYYGGKLQLPLPPTELWEITTGAPYRKTIDGHDLVVVDYSFHSVLLTGVEQPELADHALRIPGGTWTENFVLPADPDLLLDRTGYACMDEDAFPPGSVDNENFLEFYDDLCTASDEICHISGTATEDCVEALIVHVGSVDVDLEFERLAWDPVVADQYRVGTQSPGIAAGKAVREGLEDNRVQYVYVPVDSCTLQEQCVAAPGWRRVLKFTSTVQNVGGEDLALGNVEANNSPLVDHNVVVHDTCHDHYHFNYYGDFEYGDALGGKRAFCLESTSRYFNNEDTPLTHPYGCANQGIAAGWGDDYIAGIPCQWVDITDMDSSGPATDLTFDFNHEDMLCEGTPILDARGDLTFEPTGLINENGEPVDRIACDLAEGYDDDNTVSLPVDVDASGSYVNEPCDERGQFGPLRTCGFQERSDDEVCTPGERVTMTCSLVDPSAPQVLRICEASWALDDGVACVSTEALANENVTAAGAVFDFTCPSARDAVEVGGRYAVYTGALVPGWSEAGVTCTAVGDGS